MCPNLVRYITDIFLKLPPRFSQAVSWPSDLLFSLVLFLPYLLAGLLKQGVCSLLFVKDHSPCPRLESPLMSSVRLYTYLEGRDGWRKWEREIASQSRH